MDDFGIDGKVFGIGLSRTGTTSLTRALNAIGIQCIHYPHDETTRKELWSEGRLSILERYNAVTDISVSPFYRKLDSVYPDSRFILTVRDEAAWLRSLRRHERSRNLLRKMKDPQFARFSKAITKEIWGEGPLSDRDLLDGFRRHNAAVVEYFSDRARDLLVWNIAQDPDWDPLCNFLDRPVPNGPFPHANQAGFTAKWFRLESEMQSLLRDLMSSGLHIVLIDDAKLRLDGDLLARVKRFPDAASGVGVRPGSDSQALDAWCDAEIAGTDLIVVAFTAQWWRTTYPSVVEHLIAKHRVVADNRLGLFIDARRTGSPPIRINRMVRSEA